MINPEIKLSGNVKMWLMGNGGVLTRGPHSWVSMHVSGPSGWILTDDKKQEFAILSLTLDEAQNMIGCLVNAVADAKAAMQVAVCEQEKQQ